MNPYSYLRPVIDPSMFFGYQYELEKIISEVTLPTNPTSFIVMGGRGMGKTSLLRQVERRLKALRTEHTADDHQVIPIYLDMLQLEDSTLNDFLGKIAHLLNRSLSMSSLSFGVPAETKTLLQSVKTDSEPLEVLTDTLAELTQASFPTRLQIVFLIDDLWRVKLPETRAPHFKSLRALYMEPSLTNVVSYVITASYHEFDPNKPDIGSPLENILKESHLHAFDREQSLALINEPTQGQIPQEVAEQVYNETGGHPFLIQCLMSALCEHENLTQLTAEDVYQATIAFLKERRDFERWWEKLGAADRKVYRVFCERGQATADDLHRMMLSISIEGGRSLLMNKPMILDSLRILSTMGLIREMGEWESEITYELAGQWHARWFSQMYRSSTQSLL